MGIDPGISNTGFGVVRVAGARMTAIDGGTVEVPTGVPVEQRLRRIHDSIVELIEWHEPQSLALESIYFGKNVNSAIGVGQARGVVMLAAASHEIPCFDYTPQSVKLAVCGTGAAAKDQVKHMVGILLNLPVEPPSDHAADALAVAVCHASHAKRRPGRRGARGGCRLMIAAVTGEVLSRRNDHVVIDAAGVGYRLAVSAETLRTVPAVGERVSLHAHLIARDDSLALYGFATEDERELFLSLTTVSGVGPKVAMATLSGGSVGELLRALAAGDAKRFQAVPGIGKRTAERIIVELRERVAGELDEAAAVVTTESTAREEAREGLLGLGYTPIEVERLLATAEGESAEEIVAFVLRSGRAAA